MTSGRNRLGTQPALFFKFGCEQMRIAVIDGQGGGFGKAIIENIRRSLGEGPFLMALGTNSLATSIMLKAGANEGATGENAIVINAPETDFIVGSIAIIAADSMCGELTPAMAKAVADAPAKKLLIPLSRSNIDIMGVNRKPLPHYIDDMIAFLKTADVQKE